PQCVNGPKTTPNKTPVTITKNLAAIKKGCAHFMTASNIFRCIANQNFFVAGNRPHPTNKIPPTQNIANNILIKHSPVPSITSSPASFSILVYDKHSQLSVIHLTI